MDVYMHYLAQRVKLFFCLGDASRVCRDCGKSTAQVYVGSHNLLAKAWKARPLLPPRYGGV